MNKIKLTDREKLCLRCSLIEQAYDNYGHDLLKNMIVKAAINGEDKQSLIFMDIEYKITVTVEAINEQN